MNLIKTKPYFNNREHERAWLIRAAANVCKNYINQRSRKNLSLEDCEYNIPSYDNIQKTTENSEILQAVRDLPERLVTPVYLYYYEGYTSSEIAETLNKPDATIRGYLREARILLKETLKEYNREGAQMIL
jgi:RNA polymerase sigma-70 factor (ECF subfamily)